MNANELRIGNWVKRDAQPKGFIVTSYSICTCESHSEWYDPIPLNEEWLLKFNAVCQPWGWVLDGVIIRWNIIKDECRYWIELGNGKIIKLPYVHTLQNFFALTGEELTIKS